MTDAALLELLKWIVIASASGARQQRVSLRRGGRMLEPQRGRGRGESHGECRGVSLSVRQWEHYEYADQIDTNPRQWEPGEF